MSMPTLHDILTAIAVAAWIAVIGYGIARSIRLSWRGRKKG